MNQLEAVAKELKRTQGCEIHNCACTFRQPCPHCVLEQLKHHGGSPVTAALLEYLKTHNDVPQSQAIVDFWTRVAEGAQ